MGRLLDLFLWGSLDWLTRALLLLRENEICYSYVEAPSFEFRNSLVTGLLDIVHRDCSLLHLLL